MPARASAQAVTKLIFLLTIAITSPPIRPKVVADAPNPFRKLPSFSGKSRLMYQIALHRWEYASVPTNALSAFVFDSPSEEISVNVNSCESFDLSSFPRIRTRARFLYDAFPGEEFA